MKIRIRYVFPVMLMLAGCAVPGAGDDVAGDPPAGPGAAAPQQVDAVSSALGARMDALVPDAGGSVTR